MDVESRIPIPTTMTTTMTTTKKGSKNNNDYYYQRLEANVLELVKEFYQRNTQIKASHGLEHVMRVYYHTNKALECCCLLSTSSSTSPSLTRKEVMEIRCAALLHDVDDSKYFPNHDQHGNTYPNARSILQTAGIVVVQRSDDDDDDENDDENEDNDSNIILDMIAWTSTSHNGNSIPLAIQTTGNYHFLIPRWADRLEAVGAIGVVRCYQYNYEHNLPLSSNTSPRAKSIQHLWQLATPQRFQNYLDSNGHSDDMISHYYDKLLHVACPPKDSVRNIYLEQEGETSAKELIEVCLRFGKTGVVDEAYIRELAQGLGMTLG